jgi:hypothetical protein
MHGLAKFKFTKEIIAAERPAVLRCTSNDNKASICAVCSNRLNLPDFLASDGISKP